MLENIAKHRDIAKDGGGQQRTTGEGGGWWGTVGDNPWLSIHVLAQDEPTAVLQTLLPCHALPFLAVLLVPGKKYQQRRGVYFV